jgi:hypothetical protein
MRRRSLAWTRTYYVATLAFAYAACGLCWLVTWKAPAWSALVTLLESSVNVTALSASVLAPRHWTPRRTTS